MGKLSENLKAFRVFRGLKQSDLALAVGKSKNVISNWERGDNSPDVDSVETICRILRVTPNQLFGWEPVKEYELFKRRSEEQKAVIQNLQLQRQELLARVSMIDEKIQIEQELSDHMQAALSEGGKEEESAAGDLLPIAAHGHEGVTPEELAEDLKIAEEDD